ncbi:hypothetical protein [Dactylosporangium sp. CS-033363]|uniref:hypothetical protein n=1 Tax=Dactylosporangium sp. CS-033363 TaxID=3239935 RepID=UPI003D8D34C0
MSLHDLTKDPVFQVNACLWLVLKPNSGQSNPESSYGKAGYVVRALAKKLGVSPATRLSFKAAALTPEPPVPDLLFRNANDGHHLVLECKASGFTTSSSTAKQARKILIACADADNALGSPGEAFVVYVTSDDDALWLLSTLEALTEELRVLELPSAVPAVIGLTIEDDGLYAVLNVARGAGEEKLGEIRGRRLITEGNPDEARPIYIIPYDPSAAENQDADEKDYCLRLLTERVLIYCMHVIGLAVTPDCVYIDATDALKQATFNVSTRWRDNSDVDALRTRIASIIFSTLNRGELKGRVDRSGFVVSVDLDTKDEQELALSLLFKAQPSRLAEELANKQSSIVDLGF